MYSDVKKSALSDQFDGKNVRRGNEARATYRRTGFNCESLKMRDYFLLTKIETQLLNVRKHFHHMRLQEVPAVNSSVPCYMYMYLKAIRPVKDASYEPFAILEASRFI